LAFVLVVWLFLFFLDIHFISEQVLCHTMLKSYRVFFLGARVAVFIELLGVKVIHEPAFSSSLLQFLVLVMMINRQIKTLHS
jgi:hypothetical protein